MNSDLNKKNTAPTSQIAPGDGVTNDGEIEWLRRARQAYQTSTSYVDNNFRKGWDDSIRAFNNQHSADSKYNMPQYEKRSRLFRPKIRSIIRKNEAAAAAAFFSNMETTTVTPTDQNNKVEVASATIMKELLQYRLTKSIPWFQVLLGGLQDAQTVGIACAHIYWEFEAGKADTTANNSNVVPLRAVTPENEEYPEQGPLPIGTETVGPDQAAMADSQQMPLAQDISPPTEPEVKPKIDRPVIDLIPIENIRIDQGANWTDPINSSPFVIHLIPMYVMDIKDKMESGDWRTLSDAVILSASGNDSDSTRSARGKDREDPYDSGNKSVADYNIVWVQRHIHRFEGEDWEFYTLGEFALLTSPKLLRESVFHGMRPYVMGNCIIETHKTMPSSIPMLGKGLSDEAQEVVNQRIDNVKFVLNKKWFVKRGRDVDIAGLMRNVPGGAVMMEDPINDVREITWQDVTQSAYEEQGRIDNDMNDLLGNFSAGQVMADKGIQGPARNMAVLQQSTGTLVEYLLRTYVETFVQPVLRQLMLLEQKYETDKTVLSVVAKKAEMFQKFGLDEITDELLEKELTLTVNVGMGATDPQMKLQKFLTAMQAYIAMVKEPVPGINLQEVGKEIFGHLGYSDGARFFTNDDPNVAFMQDLLQKQAKVIQDLTQKVQEKMTAHQLKKESVDIVSKTKIQTTQIQQDNENLRNATTHLRAIREQDKNFAHEIASMGVKRQHALELQKEQSKMESAAPAAKTANKPGGSK